MVRLRNYDFISFLPHTMTHISIKDRAVSIIALAVLLFVFGVVNLTWAEEDKPSPANLESLANQKKNQQGIKETRPYYDALVAAVNERKKIEGSDSDGYNKFVEGYNDFLDFKSWNESESELLAKDGWCTRWADMTLVRCPLPSGPESPEQLHSSAKVLPTGDRLALLTKPCGNDTKCVCINHAIFKHDSSWATAGVGKRANNPCNMRVPATWKPSVTMSRIDSVNGEFAKFDSLEDGVTACVELYQRLYKDLPAEKLVSRWTDGGGNGSYLSAVKSCYADA